MVSQKIEYQAIFPIRLTERVKRFTKQINRFTQRRICSIKQSPRFTSRPVRFTQRTIRSVKRPGRSAKPPPRFPNRARDLTWRWPLGAIARFPPAPPRVREGMGGNPNGETRMANPIRMTE
jgi:hypothetical protein